ncbi:hypothetical protein EXS73_03520 [Candidatus Pacearchaeota archaeon]|nr:hypothetical protein [Candidatus Pacearchaeota archaeon]
MVRGWLRIVEAVIAILIVASSILIVLQQEQQRFDTNLCAPLVPLLDEIAKTSSLRSAVLARERLVLENFLKIQIVNPTIIYSFSLCSAEELCSFTGTDVSKDSDVCADERIITPPDASQNITKLKIFLYHSS